MLLGHDAAFKRLHNLLIPMPRRRAFGLVAPVGVGRQHFVRELYIKVHEDVPSISHPNSSLVDFKVVSPEKNTISVDIIRDLQDWWTKRPIQGRHRYLVFAPGEALTQESQNALLKLLEEPPEHMVMFLVSSTQDCYLSPIISRLHFDSLQLLSQKDSETIWNQQGIDMSVFQVLWALAPGQPGLALKRMNRQYPNYLTGFSNLFKTRVTAYSVMHWIDNLPADWAQEDVYDFWLWLIPKVYAKVVAVSPQIAAFLTDLSNNLTARPTIDLKVFIPALYYEHFGQ